MQKRAEPAHCWYRSLPSASWHSGTNPARSPRTPRPVSSGSFSNLISSLSPSCHCGSCHTGLLAGPGTQGVRVFTLAPSYIPFVTLSGSLFKCYLLREPLTILCKTAPQLPHTTHCACALILGPHVPATTITAVEMPPGNGGWPWGGARERREKKEIVCSPQTLQCQEPFFSILCVE